MREGSPPYSCAWSLAQRTAAAQSSMKLGEAMYKAAQEAEAAAPEAHSHDHSQSASGDKKQDEKVVDVDFEEVKDKKQPSGK